MLKYNYKKLELFNCSLVVKFRKTARHTYKVPRTYKVYYLINNHRRIVEVRLTGNQKHSAVSFKLTVSI